MVLIILSMSTHLLVNKTPSICKYYTKMEVTINFSLKNTSPAADKTNRKAGTHQDNGDIIPPLNKFKASYVCLKKR
jgi:hypothetical protein